MFFWRQVSFFFFWDSYMTIYAFLIITLQITWCSSSRHLRKRCPGTHIQMKLSFLQQEAQLIYVVHFLYIFPLFSFPAVPASFLLQYIKRLCCACSHMRLEWLTAVQAAGPAPPEPGPLCRLNRVPPWESPLGSPLLSPSARAASNLTLSVTCVDSLQFPETVICVT